MATVRKTKKSMIREEIAKERGPIKKPRKRRKPMTEEQKKAAAERLAKARAARMEKQGPPKNVHPDVLALPDDDPMSLANVREWIKVQKDLITALRRDSKAGVKGADAKLASAEGYVRNLDRYIRDGVYTDMFWGEYAQNKMKAVCIAMAYNKDGTPKRSHGTYYPDLGYVYGEEPEWAKEPEGLEAFYDE